MRFASRTLNRDGSYAGARATSEWLGVSCGKAPTNGLSAAVQGPSRDAAGTQLNCGEDRIPAAGSKAGTQGHVKRTENGR